MMKQISGLLLYPIILLLAGVFLIVDFSCKKNIEIPVLTTTAISDTTLTTASSGGNITSDGGGEITERGVYWSTNQNPAIDGNKTAEGKGSGSFISKITDLEINTTYYVQAYATNRAGTGYGNIISFKTKGTVKDIDGNLYHAIAIGTQIWMAENLKVTRYNDGSAIPLVSDYPSWAYSTSPGYCWYNNDNVNKDPYGAMYNWYAVSTGLLCPAGWHVPSDNEWTVLTNYLGGLALAAGKLKESGISHWNSPNSDATNESMFTAVPGGYRRYSDGSFFSIRDNGSYWSSTSYVSSTALSRAITLYGTSEVQVIANDKSYGISVRCIKD